MAILAELYDDLRFIFRYRSKAMKEQMELNKKAPKAGDLAPDFTLTDVSGTRSVTLSEFQGDKPVALVFGSFTWPPYVKGTVSIQQMYEKYHDHVQFLSVYIREAHPVDGWWLGRRLTKNIMLRMAPKVSMVHYDPKTIEERRAVAGECETALQYGIHTYVDEMDDSVNDTYAAWPTRLYLIGLDGKIVYGGGLGPYDFKPAKLENAIKGYLENTKSFQ